MSAHDDPFGEAHEEHENHERYLITYADMITLLMALFIILFAIGQTDLEKYKQFQQGLAEEFGAPIVFHEGASTGGGAVDLGNEATGETGVGGTPEGDAATELAGGETAALGQALLAGLGPDVPVSVRPDPRGLLVSIEIDDYVFPSGSDALTEQGAALVDALAPTLAGFANDIVVEGHTDDRPMPAPGSNWELSASRAAAVAARLVDSGVDPARLSAIGLADTEPVASNDTAEGRAHNRRMEVLLVVPGSGTGSETPSAPLVDLAGEAFADRAG